MTFSCIECFDTKLIDRAGAEITCPYCPGRISIKISGLGHGLGESGSKYATATDFKSSTITFVGTPSQIINDVVNIRQAADHTARMMGKRGRNYVNSGARAIEAHVRKALS